jgi:A/G-specific adenine glycosylase
MQEAVPHSLTHRELRLHPGVLMCDERFAPAAPDGTPLPGQWVEASALGEHGLPAPVRLMLAPLTA